MFLSVNTFGVIVSLYSCNGLLSVGYIFEVHYFKSIKVLSAH